MHQILHLTPYWEEKVWGGENLRRIKGLPADGKKWGETFEVSTLSGKEARVDGQPLHAQLPYLVKFIDTTANLSIQVHPDDNYAKKFENSKGKTECWIITHAQEGAGIFLGFRPGVEESDFFKRIEVQEDISELLNFIPVTPGDFFTIPAGAVHAIGAGITLVEVQQSSGITYRAWDWNRVGLDGNPRQLHVEQCRHVLNFDALFQESLLEQIRRDIFTKSPIELLNIDDFSLSAYILQEGQALEVVLQQCDRPAALILLSGSLELDQKQKLKPFTACLLDNVPQCKIRANETSKFIVVE